MLRKKLNPYCPTDQDIAEAVATLSKVEASSQAEDGVAKENFEKRDVRPLSTTSMLMTFLPGITAIPYYTQKSEQEQINVFIQTSDKSRISDHKSTPNPHRPRVSLRFYNQQVKNLMSIEPGPTDQEIQHNIRNAMSSDNRFRDKYAEAIEEANSLKYDGIGEYQRKLHNANVTCHELLKSAISEMRIALGSSLTKSNFEQWVGKIQSRGKKDNIEKVHVLFQVLQKIKIALPTDKKIPSMLKIDIIYCQYLTRYKKALSKLQDYYKRGILIPANSEAANLGILVKPYEQEFAIKYKKIMETYIPQNESAQETTYFTLRK